MQEMVINDMSKLKQKIKKAIQEIIKEECDCELPGHDKRPPDFYPPTEETGYYYALAKNNAGSQSIKFTQNMNDVVGDHDGETTTLFRISTKLLQQSSKPELKDLQTWSDKEGLWIGAPETKLF